MPNIAAKKTGENGTNSNNILYVIGCWCSSIIYIHPFILVVQFERWKSEALILSEWRLSVHKSQHTDWLIRRWKWCTNYGMLAMDRFNCVFFRFDETRQFFRKSSWNLLRCQSELKWEFDTDHHLQWGTIPVGLAIVLCGCNRWNWCSSCE